MRGKIIDFSLSFDGRQRLTVELSEDFRSQYDKLKDSEIDVTVKQYRKKRSLDANAYCWVLIDKLAETMQIPKSEVYKSAIRNVGGVSETVCVTDRAVDKLCEGWSRQGLGWQTERFPSKIAGCTNVILYYGSSTFDTRQMSSLINTLVDDCMTVGIETKSKEEIESLLGGNNGKN